MPEGVSFCFAMSKIAEADPDNKLLWRYPRHRMEAEAIRDSMLATSGLLNAQMGGPGVYPPVPPGMLSELSATAVAGGSGRCRSSPVVLALCGGGVGVELGPDEVAVGDLE